MTPIRRSVNSFAQKDSFQTMASTGSTTINWFTSESDDFDMMIALLSPENLFQCYWFANRQMLLHPLPIASHALGTIHDHPYPSSCPHPHETTLRVLASIVLQHYRLWYPGLIPLMVTRSPLYVPTVGGIIYWTTTLVWCRSPFFRPSVSLGVAHQLHTSSHPPHPQRSYREVHLNSTSWQTSLLVYVRVRWLQYEDCSRIPTCSSLVFRYTSGKFRNDT